MSRILIADDQRDVLEALRILLKGEGYQTEAVTSLGAVFNALEKKDYALLVMDLNYTRDTTSGTRRSGSHFQNSGDRQRVADCRDDSLGVN
jgi:CheY-like chemotaxis protein